MELKTLDDLERVSFNAEIFPELTSHNQALISLKMEAINWIKSLEKQIKGETDWYFLPQMKGLDLDEKSIIMWIKHFFNITEEDLK